MSDIMDAISLYVELQSGHPHLGVLDGKIKEFTIGEAGALISIRDEEILKRVEFLAENDAFIPDGEDFTIHDIRRYLATVLYELSGRNWHV